jgi:predicted transcriptional regulator
MADTPALSRREREIMDVVYALGRATAHDVRDAMAEPPSYSTVRALLRVLETKGHLTHVEEGPRYLFLPTVTRAKARARALSHMVNTFFDGNARDAAAALIGTRERGMSEAELKDLAALIAAARKEGR